MLGFLGKFLFRENDHSIICVASQKVIQDKIKQEGLHFISVLQSIRKTLCDSFYPMRILRALQSTDSQIHGIGVALEC